MLRFWSHCLSGPVVCVQVLVTLPVMSCCLCSGSGHTACHILLFVFRFWSHCLSDPVVCVQVLVTLPLAVLQSDSVRFQPRLPDDKARAIASLGVGKIEKVTFTFCFVLFLEASFGGWGGVAELVHVWVGASRM